MAVCTVCKDSSTIFRLLKCTTCFRPICEKCALRRYAKVFCCEECSKTYFFDDD